ncbi:hypothetical protein [Palleronia rufa]|uniref:hypothetical protein n=1 Tax=Palleronia rufa TaxID=1530186 RepID=UPI000563A7C0|nr:hypothetical protein [Palleronia rufa]
MVARFILPVLCLMASPALAERTAVRDMVSKSGEVYAETRLPAGSRLTGAGKVIRLSADCRAEIAGEGEGRWFWTAEGTTVRVAGRAIRFRDVPLLSLVRCVG